MPVTKRLTRKTIRFRPSEARLLEVAARSAGVPFGEWARETLLRRAALDMNAAPLNGRSEQPHLD